MRITVRVVDTHQVDTVEVLPGDTIAQLKERIWHLTAIPEPQQRIICAGKCLADDKTLAHYNIYDGDTVHVLLALRGD
jgi:ubiquitin-like protein Nedd8